MPTALLTQSRENECKKKQKAELPKHHNLREKVQMLTEMVILRHNIKQAILRLAEGLDGK